MRIVVLDSQKDTIILQLEFDPVEVNHELFTATTDKITEPKMVTKKSEDLKPLPAKELELYTKTKEEIREELFPDLNAEPIEEEPIKEEPYTFEEPEIIPEPSIIIIEQAKEEGVESIVSVGRFVDTIREQYCGLYDKTSEYNPEYTIGQLETVDKYNELINEIIMETETTITEEPIKKEEV